MKGRWRRARPPFAERTRLPGKSFWMLPSRLPGAHAGSRPLDVNGASRCSHRKCIGRRICAAVGDGNVNAGDAQALGEVLGGPAHEHAGLARRIVAHFHVGPAQAAPPAGAETPQDRFLGGPASCEMLDGVLALLAIADFTLRVHPRQEDLAMLLDHAADAQTLPNFSADA